MLKNTRPHKKADNRPLGPLSASFSVYIAGFLLGLAGEAGEFYGEDGLDGCGNGEFTTARAVIEHPDEISFLRKGRGPILAGCWNRVVDGFGVATIGTIDEYE